MCVCACVSGSLAEAGVLWFGVCVSMYACEARPGGSKSCLFVVCKEDEEPRDRVPEFVSISGKTDGAANSRQRPKKNNFLFLFDLRGCS